jgi:hypothetical protein
VVKWELMEIIELTPEKWLDIVNSESTPDLKHYSKNFYKLGNQYFCRIHSGYGNIISPMCSTTEGLDKAEKDIDRIYEETKGRYFLKPDQVEPLPTPF